jgi:small subunit ribosomal protein S3
MEEKKFVGFKKEELRVKEYVKRTLGKGKISNVSIEYTPVGEKIIVATSKPGLVIGRRGEKIDELTKFIKKRFKFDNPHIEIKEIRNALLDAQLVADEIALALENLGSLKFKVIAYKMLTNIMKAGALGVEIVLSGRLPSERARSWRFSQGYMMKTGDPAKVVDRAMAQAVNIQGVSGIKVAILHPEAHIHDKIVIDEAFMAKLRANQIIIEDDKIKIINDAKEAKELKESKVKKTRSKK